MCKEQDRQRLTEDRKALRDAIKRAMSLGDELEVTRLTKHLNWLENYLKGEQNENTDNPVVPAGD